MEGNGNHALNISIQKLSVESFHPITESSQDDNLKNNLLTHWRAHFRTSMHGYCIIITLTHPHHYHQKSP